MSSSPTCTIAQTSATAGQKTVTASTLGATCADGISWAYKTSPYCCRWPLIQTVNTLLCRLKNQRQTSRRALYLKIGNGRHYVQNMRYTQLPGFLQRFQAG